MEFDEGCKVPALVPYQDLMKFVGEQDIGKLNIPHALAERETENESEEINDNLLPLTPGHYIASEERLLQLADFYLRGLIILIGLVGKGAISLWHWGQMVHHSAKPTKHVPGLLLFQMFRKE